MLNHRRPFRQCRHRSIPRAGDPLPGDTLLDAWTAFGLCPDDDVSSGKGKPPMRQQAKKEVLAAYAAYLAAFRADDLALSQDFPNGSPILA